MKRLRAELLLVAVTIIWGTTFVVVKAALTEVSPLLFLLLRFVLAAGILGALFGKSVHRKGIAAGCLAGALLFAAYVFQTAGLQLTTPSKSAFLTSLSVPLVPLASSFVYRVRPRPLEAVGIAVATLGMVLMTAPPGRWEIDRGDWLSFLCAVVFALHIVVVGHFAPIVGFQSLAVVQTAVAALLSALFCGTAGVFGEPLRFRLTAQVAGAVLLTGLLATALAFTVQAWAQQYTSATRAALIFSLEPVVAWVTSWLVAGETLASRGKVGAGFILGGILLVELKRSKPERHQLIGAEIPPRDSRRVDKE